VEKKGFFMKLDTRDYESRMKKSVAAYNETLSTIRAGRANPDVLKKINVDYYGSPTAISAIAEVKVTDARTITITAWDKSIVKGIEKAILTSDLGINPQSDGSVIRLSFPPTTEERRKELSKQVAKLGEDAKVAIRNIRRDANDKVKAEKKASTMTEDEAKASDKAIQDLTDKYVKEIDVVTAAKTKEVMEI
jgi:ribosome recycling factor